MLSGFRLGSLLIILGKYNGKQHLCWVKPSLKWPSNMLTPVLTTISVALKTEVSSEGGEWLFSILGYVGVRG